MSLIEARNCVTSSEAEYVFYHIHLYSSNIKLEGAICSYTIHFWTSKWMMYTYWFLKNMTHKCLVSLAQLSHSIWTQNTSLFLSNFCKHIKCSNKLYCLNPGTSLSFLPKHFVTVSTVDLRFKVLCHIHLHPKQVQRLSTSLIITFT